MRTSALAVVVATAAAAVSAGPRYCMYFDEWHKTTPPKELTAGIQYVITAFAPSDMFINGSTYTPFMPLDQIRTMFDKGTKVCMAIGGWGDTTGFSAGAATDETRKKFAQSVAKTLDTLGYDCVDIDWEYPGGNGQDYKQVPNEAKKSEIETFPLLLTAIKAAIGTKELSIAVPGREVDMMAYGPDQVPKIDKAVDFVNVMAYDLMNRRDNMTMHHTSVEGSKHLVETYIKRGMTPAKMNLGFAFYAKYFTTAGACNTPTGCPTALLEAPDGKDTEKSGSVTFEAENYAGSLKNVMANGRADAAAGGQWWWDSTNNKYWTWDTPEFMARKMKDIVVAEKLGGVFGWSLSEDSYDWSHLKALKAAVEGANASPPAVKCD